MTCAVTPLLFTALVYAQATGDTSEPKPTIGKPVATPVVVPVESGITNPGTPQTSQDKRIFGVLPNYRTVDGTLVFEPLTTAQKYHIAVKDSFDWPGFFVAAAFAGLYQAENEHPNFGQGIEGYAKRYGTAYVDQVVGNMMTEAVLPSLLHEDPRYFRLVNGTVKHRLWYAATRVFVTHTDSGGTRFNTSEILGNGIAGSVGNAYYADERGFGDTMDRMWTAIGTDAISDVLKEFWPDIKRHYFHKHVDQTVPGS